MKRTLAALDFEYETEHVSLVPPLRSSVGEIGGQSQVPVLVDPAHGVEGMNENADAVE